MRTPTISLTAIYSTFCFLLAPTLVVAPKAVAPLLLLAALAAAASAWVSARRLETPDKTMLALFGLLFLWAGVSCLWSPDPVDSLVRLLRVIGLIAAGLVLAAQALSLNREQRDRVARWLVIGFALGVLLLISERLTGSALHFLGSEPKPGLSILSVLNRGATGLAILVWPATLILWRGRLGRWALLAPLAVLALVATLESQAAILSLAAGLVFAGISILSHRTARGILLALPIVAAVALPVASGWLYGSDLHDRGLISESNEHRLSIWAFVSDRIADKPLIGWGFDGSRRLPEQGTEPHRSAERVMESHPHNAMLQTWVELGAVGLIFVLAILTMLIRRFERLPQDEQTAAQALFVTSLCIACLSYGLWQSQWLATLLAAGQIVIHCRRDAAAIARAAPVEEARKLQ